jgi:Cytoskeletal-regulatory complex EF hand
VPPHILYNCFTQDGALDLPEYTVAMHLCMAVKAGDTLPDVLPPELVPPQKRHLVMGM